MTMRPTDHNDLIISIKTELAQSWSFQPLGSPAISRVPGPMRSVRPSAFTPQTVAIGPFHRKLLRGGEDALSFTEMESYKIMAAKAMFLDPASFDLLAHDISRDAEEVRSCFDKGFGLEDLDNEHLGYMLALDATFVVTVLHSLCEDHAPCEYRKSPPSDFTLLVWHRFPLPVRKAVLLDFLLLENQIPLFLLKKVMQMDPRYEASLNHSVVDMQLQTFVEVIAGRHLPFGASKGCIGVGIKRLGTQGQHLLDFLYTIVTQRRIKESDESIISNGTLKFHPCAIPSATVLVKAGVKFKGHDDNLTEISFEHHTLKIPRIHVGDETEMMFRNLLAYESTMPGKADILSYLHFMNFLISTSEDVGVLVGAGVVSETIGSNKLVADMWNELATNTVCVFTQEYSEVARRTREYAAEAIHGMMAELIQRYFSRPWLVVSLVSGIGLLVMTFVTMWYTMQAYMISSRS